MYLRFMKLFCPLLGRGGSRRAGRGGSMLYLDKFVFEIYYHLIMSGIDPPHLAELGTPPEEGTTYF